MAATKIKLRKPAELQERTKVLNRVCENKLRKDTKRIEKDMAAAKERCMQEQREFFRTQYIEKGVKIGHVLSTRRVKSMLDSLSVSEYSPDARFKGMTRSKSSHSLATTSDCKQGSGPSTGQSRSVSFENLPQLCQEARRSSTGSEVSYGAIRQNSTSHSPHVRNPSLRRGLLQRRQSKSSDNLGNVCDDGHETTLCEDIYDLKDVRVRKTSLPLQLSAEAPPMRYRSATICAPGFQAGPAKAPASKDRPRSASAFGARLGCPSGSSDDKIDVGRLYHKLRETLSAGQYDTFKAQLEKESRDAGIYDAKYLILENERYISSRDINSDPRWRKITDSIEKEND